MTGNQSIRELRSNRVRKEDRYPVVLEKHCLPSEPIGCMSFDGNTVWRLDTVASQSYLSNSS